MTKNNKALSFDPCLFSFFLLPLPHTHHFSFFFLFFLFPAPRGEETNNQSFLWACSFVGGKRDKKKT